MVVAATMCSVAHFVASTSLLMPNDHALSALHDVYSLLYKSVLKFSRTSNSITDTTWSRLFLFATKHKLLTRYS